MADEIKKPQSVKLQIQLDPQTALGQYANGVIVNHSDAEFILDFLFVQPQAPAAKVLSRVITSPARAKRLAVMLADHVQRYELAFGEIRDTTPKDNTPDGGEFLN